MDDAGQSRGDRTIKVVATEPEEPECGKWCWQKLNGASGPGADRIFSEEK